MIKVVSFDIGGTLIKGVNNNYTITEFSKLANCDYNDIKCAYRDIFQKREGTFDELFSLFCQKLKIKETDAIKIYLKDNFNQDSYFDIDSIPIMQKLKDLGYKIILFSNNSSLYPDKIPDKVKEIVDELFYSHIMGHTKDESITYRKIEDKMGYKSNEFFHIGDSIDNDYLYPIKNGWHAVLLGDNDKVQCISSINEIFDYLDKINNEEKD